MALDRREALRGAGALATASLAGCFTASTAEKCGSETYPPEGFRITNRDTSPHTVSITVIRELLLYSETIFNRSYDLGTTESGEMTVLVERVVKWAGPHIVKIGLEDGDSETYLWQVTPAECDTLIIIVSGDGIRILAHA
jgi:hypothetical protein